MHSRSDIERVASTLLDTRGLVLQKCRVVQTLWAGYGHICSIEATRSTEPTDGCLSLILKYVSPPVKKGQKHDEGHLRKIISYQVEQYFYAHLVPLMPREIGVASCLASADSHNPAGNITAMMLTDLRKDYPVAGEKRGELGRQQVSAAIDWLATFHGFWWPRTHDLLDDKLRHPPLKESRMISSESVTRSGSVWLNGGYTYLATRLSEYTNLSEDNSSDWNKALCTPFLPSTGESLAQIVARLLSPSIEASAISEFQTLIHGDVKSENLFTTTKGDAVAFYDFQYVGLGLGTCDLAKLFTCSVPGKMLSDIMTDGFMHRNEEALLRQYLSKLQKVSGRAYAWATFVRHWETALVDWLRFQASWGFWGNTEWLEMRVRTIVADQEWKSWLLNELGH